MGKLISGQMSLFDMPRSGRKPGDYQKTCGAIIPHIMREAYIGSFVLYDVHTQSQRPLFQLGILEKYIPYEGKMRAVIYTGKTQRALVTFYPGIEIWEPEPIDRAELAREINGLSRTPAPTEE